MICYLLFRSLYMDICLPVCGGVFRWFLKISSTYIGKFSSLCGGISPNFFKNPPTIIGHLPYPLAGCFRKKLKASYLYWKVTTLLSGYFTKFLRKNFSHLTKDTKIRKFGVYRKIFLPYIPRT